MNEWEAVLDCYETALDHHAARLAEEGTGLENPWPPSELPTTPIPEELRERAERLLGRSHGLIDDVAGAMAALPPRRASRVTRRDTPDQPRWKVRL